MRVTIEIDEKSGSASADAGPVGGGANAQQAGSEAPSAHAVPSAPPEVLEQAAATGAINGGPAPALAGSTGSAPHPFHSHGGAMSESAHAAAESGGAAPQN